MSRLASSVATGRRGRSAEPTPASAAEDPDFVAAAARALAVLDAFTPEQQRLGNGEIAERSGLPKSTVSRLTYTLARQGYLAFDAATQHYRLGPAVLGLARSFLAGRGVREAARPHMEALAMRFRAPVALTERDGLDMVYLEYCRGDAPVIVPRGIGSRVALAKSAAGRAWMACAAEPEAQAVRAQLQEQAGTGWRAVERRLLAGERDLAQRGFTRSYGEVQAEVNSVAVPFRSPVDGSLTVFNLAAPSMMVGTGRFDEELGPALVGMVQAVQALLAPPPQRGAP